MKAAALALALASALPAAQAESVFGFVLGEKLTLPDCPYRVTAGGTRLEEMNPPVVCVAPAHALNGYDIPVREIRFPLQETPPIVKNSVVFPLEIDGRLIGLHFITAGLSTQDLVLQQLTDKFGAPARVERAQVQNLAGGTFGAVQATWQRADLQVRFDSTALKLTAGEVFIDTPAAVQLRAEWQSKRNSKARPL